MGAARAIGFDLDGTLFDHRGAAATAVDAFLRQLGIEPTEHARSAWFDAEDEQFERWRAGRISFPEQRRERLRLVLPALGVAAPTEPAELDRLFARYLRAYRAAWRPFPDSVDLLRRLRASGYRVGILTNGTEEQQRAKLDATGLGREVDVVCTSQRIGAQKPDALAFLTLARELGAARADCLFVGDNAEHDVAGARAAGMRALLIDRYGEHREGIAAAVLHELAGR